MLRWSSFYIKHYQQPVYILTFRWLQWVSYEYNKHILI